MIKGFWFTRIGNNDNRPGQITEIQKKMKKKLTDRNTTSQGRRMGNMHNDPCTLMVFITSTPPGGRGLNS